MSDINKNKKKKKFHDYITKSAVYLRYFYGIPTHTTAHKTTLPGDNAKIKRKTLSCVIIKL